MNLYFVRHTRVKSPTGICYGNLEVELADSFCREAKKVQKKLTGINFDRAYTSPMKRCVRLANLLSKNPKPDSRIKEFNFGDWEGKTWDYIYSLPEGQKWFDEYENAKIPNGESFQMLLNRVKNFTDDFPANYDNVLIVTHAGVIRCFQILLERRTVAEVFAKKIEYGEIIKIKY